MIIIYIVLVYAGLGVIFSIPFLSRWIHIVDESTHESGLTFKLIILPGCIVFWPLLLKRFLESKQERP